MNQEFPSDVEVTSQGRCRECSHYNETQTSPAYEGICTLSNRMFTIKPYYICHVPSRKWVERQPTGSLCSIMIRNTLWYEERKRHQPRQR